MQELSRTNGGGLQVLDVGVIDHQDLASFLHVHNPLRLDERRNDGCHAWLRVVLTVNGNATGRNHLQRLQRVAFHDGVLRWPVAASNGVLVFKALELGGIDRARVEGNFDFSYNAWLFHPQVDQRHTTIATDHVNVTARSGHAGDMHCIASLDDAADFFGVAVNQSNFTGITQSDREHVVQVVLVHLLGWAILHLNHNFPRIQLILEAELWWNIRRLLDVLGHQRQLFFGQNVVKVDHAAIGTVTDDFLQARLAQGERAAFGGLACFIGGGPMRLQVLARGALAQHAVATSTTLEIDFFSSFFFDRRHCRRLRIFILCHDVAGKTRQHHHCSDGGKAGKCHRVNSIVFLQPTRPKEAEIKLGDGCNRSFRVGPLSVGAICEVLDPC